MVNILLEGSNLVDEYLVEKLNKYIKPNHKVLIIPFSFDRGVRTPEEWADLFGRKYREYYNELLDGFKYYGVPEEHIQIVNYFLDNKDDIIEKIKKVDIVYFTGGLPDKMEERIEQIGIYEALSNYKGIVMGDSAGAMVQFKEFHISPDEDYDEFAYHRGLPYIDSFYLEPHFEHNKVQNEAINKVLLERKKSVFAIEKESGAIIVDNGEIKTIGKVIKFVKLMD